MSTDNAREFPLAPQQMQPKTQRGRKTPSLNIPQETLATWRSAVAQCPHTRRTEIESWIASKLGVRGTNLSSVIDETRALDRNMPADFIDALFGLKGTPSRRALDLVFGSLDQTIVPSQWPIEGGLTLGIHGINFATIRPMQGGVVLAVSKLQRTNKPMKTLLYQVRFDEPLSKVVAAELNDTIRILNDTRG